LLEPDVSLNLTLSFAYLSLKLFHNELTSFLIFSVSLTPATAEFDALTLLLISLIV